MIALRKFFKLEELGTTVRQEVIAGTTTFLTMAYIIFVNPAILSATGMDKGALITATILASAFGTLLAGLWANVPFAMAPGMGLNAFFAFSLVLGNKVSWETALGVVFVSGVIFLVLTLCGVRAKVIKAIPLHLRLAIAAGIGLFITFIGFQNLGLIVKTDATMIGLGKISRPVLLGLAALLLTPLIGIVPSFATAPALIVVGVYMFKNVRDIDFRDFGVAVPAFLTIILMPLTYSISTGLAFGFVAHVLIMIASGKVKTIHPVMWVIGVFSSLDLVLALWPKG